MFLSFDSRVISNFIYYLGRKSKNIVTHIPLLNTNHFDNHKKIDINPRIFSCMHTLILYILPKLMKSDTLGTTHSARSLIAGSMRCSYAPKEIEEIIIPAHICTKTKSVLTTACAAFGCVSRGTNDWGLFRNKGCLRSRKE